MTNAQSANDEDIVYPARPLPSKEPLSDDEVAELVALIDAFGLSGASRRLRVYRATLSALAARVARTDSNQLYRARLFEAKFRGDLDEAKRV